MTAGQTRDPFHGKLPVDRRLTGEDVEGLRFRLSRNGYEPSQIDVVLDRLSAEIAERDRWIAYMESLLAEHGIAVTPDSATTRAEPGNPEPDGFELGNPEPDNPEPDSTELNGADPTGSFPAYPPVRATDPAEPSDLGLAIEHPR